MTKLTSCPVCRGEIHAIAGRCKHCKADLVELRERAARAARAQALGATVPPPAAFGFFGPPGPRPSVQPPAPYPPAPYPPAPYPPATDAAPGMAGPGPGSGLTAAPPLHAGAEPGPAPEEAAPLEPAPFLPDDGQVLGPPPHGTPPYGLGLARVRSRRASSWSRRWPLVVSAVALLAIGISIGVLAERWRQQSARRADGRRETRLSRSPVSVPDHMPQPILPQPGLPSARAVPDREPSAGSGSQTAPGDADDPDPDPDRSAQPAEPPPDPAESNPGSRFSQPPPSQPGGGDAGAFRTFTAALTDSLCDKLSQCGFLDGQTQSMCRQFAHELDPGDAAEKVARGECSFNQRAAEACLRAVADLRCDTGASDRVMEWLLAPNKVGRCAEAYVCQ